MSKYVGGFNEAPRNISEERINRRLGESVLGARSVNNIDVNGVLEIRPSDGKYITIVDHGAADFEITGFGDNCPVGYEIVVTVPRTIGDTGGTANELGNYVQFVHTASGDGLDLELNKRMDSGSALYTYQAYPNATDAFGNAAALHEQFTFVCTSQSNGGRWKLVKLPEDGVGSNDNGEWNISANGRAEFTNLNISPPIDIPSTGQLVMSAFPINVQGSQAACSWSFSDYQSTSARDRGHYLYIGGSAAGTANGWRMVNNSPDGGISSSARFNLFASGRWKPSV